MMHLGDQNQWLTIPNTSKFPGKFPLVFIIPDSGMTCLKGRGMHELSQVLVNHGFATYRFVPQGDRLDVAETLSRYQTALSQTQSRRRNVGIIGLGEGADLLAKHYYQFYPFCLPQAAVMLSPSVQSLYLNNLTCPYLLLHGGLDPALQSIPYGRFLEAVHHHQSRYGDDTTHYLFRELGRELGNESLAPEVITQIIDWLARSISKGLRRQEPAAGAAA